VIRAAAILVVAAACAHHSAPPPAKPAIDTAAIAAEIEAEQADLAAILHRDRADCPALAADLKALFARMTASFARARDAQRDPETARGLTTDMKRYDAAAAARARAMEADLTVDAPCVRDPAVRDVLMAMPTL
jgi:hypothetical protein